MAIDVSVIIPVYNPGRSMDVCVDGLLAQTLGQERLELIFVDDGSTDDGGQLIDDLAAAHPNVTAFHQDNSGHPGGPRNIGLDAAVGEYVFFCDHDDWLEPEALERMLGHARRTGADVVIPKMTGHRRAVPWMLFRETVDNARPDVVPVMNALTPHKLFRREFLVEHGIRFPEKVRLEDHVFMTESYLQAGVITIAADYPYFHHPRQDDGGNISLARPIEPDYYYSCVDLVLDAIERLTEPGPLRNEVLRRPFAVEMLARLEGPGFLKRDSDWQAEAVREIRARATTRFPDGFHEQLALVRRAAARAMLAGDVGALERLAAASAEAKCHGLLLDLRGDGTSYRLDLEIDLVLGSEGSPVGYLEDGNGWRVDERLLPRDLDPEPHSETEVTAYVVNLLLRHRGERVEWFVPTRTTTALVPIDGQPDACRVVVSLTGSIDPQTLAAGQPLRPGDWDLFVRLDALGIERAIAGGFDVASGFAVPEPIGTTKPRYNPDNGRLVFAVKKVQPTSVEPDAAVAGGQGHAKRRLLTRLDRKLKP